MELVKIGVMKCCHGGCKGDERSEQRPRASRASPVLYVPGLPCLLASLP